MFVTDYTIGFYNGFFGLHEKHAETLLYWRGFFAGVKARIQ